VLKTAETQSQGNELLEEREEKGEEKLTPGEVK